VKQVFYAVLFAVTLAAQAQTKIVFTWGNPSATVPKCSTIPTNPSMCMIGQTMTETTNPATPIPINQAIDAYATTYTITPLPTKGDHTYSLVSNFLDFSGKPAVTPVVTTTVTVPAPFVVAPPTGFSGTIQ
jgi:hypothetical protein